MMVDRLLLSDIKEEIMEMQYEINATYNPPAPVIPVPVADLNEAVKTPKIDHEFLLSPQKSPMLSPTMKYNSSPMGMLQSPLTPGENRILQHQMSNHSMMDHQKPYPNSLSSPMSAASPYMMPNSPLVQQQQSQERFPPCMHQGKLGPSVQSVSHLPQIPVRPLMVSPPHAQSVQQKHSNSRFYSNNVDESRKSKKSKQAHVSAQDEPKKDMENFDIESEITPSFIMKSAPVPCDDLSDKSPVMQNHSLPSMNDQEDTLPSHQSSPIKDMNNSSAGSDDMDIDYFGNPPQSHTSNHALSDFDRLKSGGGESNETPNHKADEEQDSEPYDEWLCIQKALEEHNTRPLGHHLENRATNGRNTSDLYQQATTQHLNEQANKLSERQFNELFPSSHNSTQHTNHDGKLTVNDHSPPSPFAELFNSSDINAGASGSSNDSSVKETMGQMYGGDSEEISAKNNEIVESRLEALFEGKFILFPFQSDYS